jgi:hypothetical protein
MQLSWTTEKAVRIAGWLAAIGLGYYCGADFLIPAIAGFVIAKWLARTGKCPDPLHRAVLSINGGYAVWFAIGLFATRELALSSFVDPVIIWILLIPIFTKSSKGAAYCLVAYHIFGLLGTLAVIVNQTGALVSDHSLLVHLLFRVLGGGTTFLLIRKLNRSAKLSAAPQSPAMAVEPKPPVQPLPKPSGFSRGQKINAAVWMYVWLSNVLMPVTVPPGGDFWVEWSKHLIQVNESLLGGDFSRWAASAMFPFIFWWAIHRLLQQRRIKAMQSAAQPPKAAL